MTMKNFMTFSILMAAAILCASCADLFRKEENGSIGICFEQSFFRGTKGSADIPDEGDFTITVTDADGNEVYGGKYRSSPETIEVPAGNYTISAVSREFDEPLFNAPQFGDSQVVTVLSGQNVSVTMNCRQMNCGVRLSLDSYFRTAFPEGVLYLNSSSGTLMYGYSENRTAYFKPGGLTVSLWNDGAEQTVCTRTLEAQQMLTLAISATVGDATTTSGVSLQIDTSRIWISDSIVIGGGGADGPADAYDIIQARSHTGESGVWVYGYIVGVATGTGKFSFTSPFSKNTNIVIGLRSGSTEDKYLMTVELPKGDIRDELNLQYNPELLGTKIYLKGDVSEAYYGIPGIRNVSAYESE